MLTFGYNAGLPDGVRAAWGARFIFPDDLLHDRTGIFGDEADRKALIEWLNSGVLRDTRDAARNAGLRPEEDREVVLYEDDKGKVVANPNGSYGYLYVAGWLKGHEPVADGEDGAIYADTTNDDEIKEIEDLTGVQL
jgi:hypothetical protein